MTRLLPHPLLAAGMLAMWVLLTQSFSPGQILLGIVVAFLASQGFAALRQERPRIRSIGAAFKLAGVVAIDILRSNFAVARIILSSPPKRVSGFVRLPITLKSRHGLAVLALIITATPGTTWVAFDRARGSLLIHVLDLVDEEEWARLVKQRYERLLKEVFGG